MSAPDRLVVLVQQQNELLEEHAMLARQLAGIVADRALAEKAGHDVLVSVLDGLNRVVGALAATNGMMSSVVSRSEDSAARLTEIADELRGLRALVAEYVR